MREDLFQENNDALYHLLENIHSSGWEGEKKKKNQIRPNHEGKHFKVSQLAGKYGVHVFVLHFMNNQEVAVVFAIQTNIIQKSLSLCFTGSSPPSTFRSRDCRFWSKGWMLCQWREKAKRFMLMWTWWRKVIRSKTRNDKNKGFTKKRKKKNFIKEKTRDR